MLLFPLLIANVWPGASVLDLVVFQDASGQIEHLLPASHLRKTSNRLLSSLFNSMGYVDDRLRHMRKRKVRFQVGCGCEWGWGLQEKWVSTSFLQSFEVVSRNQLFFVQLCKNGDFFLSFSFFFLFPFTSSIFCIMAPPSVPSHPTPPHPIPATVCHTPIYHKYLVGSARPFVCLGSNYVVE